MKIRAISVISGQVLTFNLGNLWQFRRFWQFPLLLPQKPYPSIQRPMICPKERQERRRVHVVINHRGIFAIQDVVHSNTRRPAVSVKRELAFHCSVQGKEIREAELSRAGNDLPKLVNRHKAES